MLVVTSLPATGTEIYRCTDAEGNVAFLQFPCPAEKVEVAEADKDANADELTEPSPAPQVPSSRAADEPVEDCKKRYRDQIDEIDAEILIAYSPEESEMYKERLLALTRQLRACG